MKSFKNVKSILIAVIMVMFLATSCSNSTKALLEQGMKALNDKDYEIALQYFNDAVEEDASKENLLALKMAEEFIQISSDFDYFMGNKEAIPGDMTGIYVVKDRMEKFKKDYKKYSELDASKSLENDINAELSINMDNEMYIFTSTLIEYENDKKAGTDAVDNYITKNTKYLTETQISKLEDIKKIIKKGDLSKLINNEGEEITGNTNSSIDSDNDGNADDEQYTDVWKDAKKPDEVSDQEHLSSTASPAGTPDYAQMSDKELTKAFNVSDAIKIVEKTYGKSTTNGGTARIECDHKVPKIQGYNLYYNITVNDPISEKISRIKVYDDEKITILESKTYEQ